jgi:hypothetical protein
MKDLIQEGRRIQETFKNAFQIQEKYLGEAEPDMEMLITQKLNREIKSINGRKLDGGAYSWKYDPSKKSWSCKYDKIANLYLGYSIEHKGNSGNQTFDVISWEAEKMHKVKTFKTINDVIKYFKSIA